MSLADVHLHAQRFQSRIRSRNMIEYVAAAFVVVFFGWTAGWFDPTWPSPTHGQREPERRAAQLRPELITVLSPDAASAALAAAQAASGAGGP